MCTPAHAPTAKSGTETPQRFSDTARVSYRPFHDSVPWWLSVDVRERTRRAVRTRKANESFQHTAHSRSINRTTTIYSQQQQTGPTAVAAARSSSGGVASGGGQLRASEPPIVRLMTPCLCGCASLGFVRCALCYLVMFPCDVYVPQVFVAPCMFCYY